MATTLTMPIVWPQVDVKNKRMLCFQKMLFLRCKCFPLQIIYMLEQVINLQDLLISTLPKGNHILVSCWINFYSVLTLRQTAEGAFVFLWYISIQCVKQKTPQKLGYYIVIQIHFMLYVICQFLTLSQQQVLWRLPKLGMAKCGRHLNLQSAPLWWWWNNQVALK